MKIFWVINLLGVFASVLCILGGLIVAGAPAQAAAYAAACAFSVVPYVLSRTVKELYGSKSEKHLEEIAQALKKSA